eukprot:803014_1
MGEISKRAWISLAMGVLASLNAGTNYAFSSWSDTLKTRYGYSQSEVAVIGALANVGQYMSIVCGVVIDFWGVRLACCIAAFLNFTGYFLLHLVARGSFPPLSGYFSQAILFFVASWGSCFLFISGFTANIRAFPDAYRGRVVGAILCGYALCSAIVSSVYRFAFQNSDLSGFLLYLTVTTTLVSLL